ncbi:hypothetical protein Q1W73_09780 [Asticcacaulis sp. ZE23SCel15]|uniref:hypothetical protein n=1 Tax=Asticcacaulis sp. ZE23SCel15 TaxID=3059027 RepID=UPI00265E3304|nr:hypothetical protein [Asticcacaulis sp. ZE23SCel15]WKL55991.1 hypothetical protein Q1W73_09780 [Asticcacaulis sp. ZE23SCel15]
MLVICAWLITPHLQRGYDPGIYTALLDAFVTLVLFAISYRSRRLWTIMITSCHLAGALTHLAAHLSLSVGYYAYLTTLGLLGA